MCAFIQHDIISLLNNITRVAPPARPPHSLTHRGGKVHVTGVSSARTLEHRVVHSVGRTQASKLSETMTGLKLKAHV